MKNKKYLIIPAVAFVALLAAGSASAYGGHAFGGLGGSMFNAENFEKKMSEQAGILGVSVADMKTAWAAGKNIHDIAKEKGVSDEDLKAKMQAKHQEEMKGYLQTLVNNGSITQAQADSRLKFMQDHQANKKVGEGRKMGGRGQGGCMLNQK